MSPSSKYILNDRQLTCNHIVGIVPAQVGSPGYGPLVYEDNQGQLRTYGGMAFFYCPICEIELVEDYQ